MKTETPDIDISYLGATAGLTDYIDWECVTPDQWVDLSLWFSRAWLPNQLVAISLLRGEVPQAKLLPHVEQVHGALLAIFRWALLSRPPTP